MASLTEVSAAFPGSSFDFHTSPPRHTESKIFNNARPGHLSMLPSSTKKSTSKKHHGHISYHNLHCRYDSHSVTKKTRHPTPKTHELHSLLRLNEWAALGLLLRENAVLASRSCGASKTLKTTDLTKMWNIQKKKKWCLLLWAVNLQLIADILARNGFQGFVWLPNLSAIQKSSIHPGLGTTRWSHPPPQIEHPNDCPYRIISSHDWPDMSKYRPHSTVNWKQRKLCSSQKPALFKNSVGGKLRIHTAPSQPSKMNQRKGKAIRRRRRTFVCQLEYARNANERNYMICKYQWNCNKSKHYTYFKKSYHALKIVGIFFIFASSLMSWAKPIVVWFA